MWLRRPRVRSPSVTLNCRGQVTGDREQPAGTRPIGRLSPVPYPLSPGFPAPVEERQTRLKRRCIATLRNSSWPKVVILSVAATPNLHSRRCLAATDGSIPPVTIPPADSHTRL